MPSSEFNTRFLTATDHTGRFIVTSTVTGKKYYVEPVDNAHHAADWGDLDPVSKKLTGHYGEKYCGSVREQESLLTLEQGFTKIHDLGPGESPLAYIERLDRMAAEKSNLDS